MRFMTRKYIPPFGRLPFLFVDSFFFCCKEAFKFNVVSFVYFFLLLSLLLMSNPKKSCQGLYREAYQLCFILGVL